ncbi:phage protease [Escherichia coli]|uniref:phage protease n=1 Tax=Escherichia coli TaxID=562 RepID=UPI0039A6A5C0
MDGRPHTDEVESGKWVLTAELAAQLVAQVAARTTPFVIDYEHQTLRAVNNGKPAPAAGWFSQVEWREGAGLYATGVEWTDNAAAMIAAGEYKFISPVFCLQQARRSAGAVTCCADQYPCAGRYGRGHAGCGQPSGESVN